MREGWRARRGEAAGDCWGGRRVLEIGAVGHVAVGAPDGHRVSPEAAGVAAFAAGVRGAVRAALAPRRPRPSGRCWGLPGARGARRGRGGVHRLLRCVAARVVLLCGRRGGSLGGDSGCQDSILQTARRDETLSRGGGRGGAPSCGSQPPSWSPASSPCSASPGRESVRCILSGWCCFHTPYRRPTPRRTFSGVFCTAAGATGGAAGSLKQAPILFCCANWFLSSRVRLCNWALERIPKTL